MKKQQSRKTRELRSIIYHLSFVLHFKDQEIADKIGISRRYVNKLKKFD